MSSPTCVRVRPYRKIFDTRKSMLVRRSAYSVPGSIRLIVTLLAPDRLRPRNGRTKALFATKFAASCGPGSLDQVPLSCTSMRGMVYVASPRMDVWNGWTTRQYGFTNPGVVVAGEYA